MDTLAVRNQNPGNLKDPSTGSFRKFNSPQEGFEALKNDLNIKISGKSTTGVTPNSSLAHFASIYAPASDNNDPKSYADNLAAQLGVSPDTPISALSSRLDDFARAIAQNEDKTMAQTLKTATEQPLATANVGSFAEKIKAKYPQYADMDNAELEQKMIAKYPQYADLATQDVPQASPTGYPKAPEVPKYEAPVKEEVQGKDKNLAQKGLEFLFPILEKKERTPLQTVGDLGMSALTLVPGLGALGLGAKGLKAASIGAKAIKGAKEASKAGKLTGLLNKSNVAKGLGVGYGTDVGTKLSEGETDLGEIVTPGLGTAIGGTLGGAGSVLSKASKFLPERIVRKYIPGTSEGVAKYASTKTLGSPKEMLQETDSSIKLLGNKLGNTLKSSEYRGMEIPGRDLYSRVVEKFPNVDMNEASFYKELKKLVPLQGRLVDKLQKKGLSLEELHKLNSEIGQNTFKTVFDDPTVKAGKQIGNEFYHATSDAIKLIAPETGVLFKQLSMEYPLRKALEKAVRSGDKRKAIGLYEIMALMGGTAINPVAGIPAAIGVSALRSPTVNLYAAELLKKSQGKIPGLVGSSTLAPLTRALKGLISQ